MIEKKLTPRAIVTTARKWSKASEELAQATADSLKLSYVERGTRSLTELRAGDEALTIVVAGNNKLTLDTSGGKLFFHPNMAHLRVKNIRLGDGDRLIEAMQLKSGMSVLDCTLGFGSDAIVASFVAGSEGKVLGVESNPLIEAVVSYGLANFTDDTERIITAMRGIKTVCADALTFLRQQPAKSFDVVYFDPMFRHPFLASKSLDPLRAIADKRALTIETITEAKRVARQRVVMKETSRSLEFARLGFPIITGGHYSRVQYGVIELTGQN